MASAHQFICGLWRKLPSQFGSATHLCFSHSSVVFTVVRRKTASQTILRGEWTLLSDKELKELKELKEPIEMSIRWATGKKMVLRAQRHHIPPFQILKFEEFPVLPYDDFEKGVQFLREPWSE